MTSFNSIVNMLRKDTSKATMASLIEWVKSHAVTDEEIADLANLLATSGKILNFSNRGMTADVASTGGPTSLSTLLCPLYLREFGAIVLKLAVPGRPAGGIDVLCQIPGYQARLKREELIRVLNICGYVHMLADENFTPLDATLFSFRQKVGAQNLQPLVIASLLSKKIAMGLSKVGLDIRVSEFGNFGKDWEEAKVNAIRFCRVSMLLEIDCTCFLTDASVPFQPYIGRGESLIALSEIFKDISTGQLAEHAKLCMEMAALTVADERKSGVQGKDLLYHFGQNLQAQGSSLEAFQIKVDETINGHQHIITSATEGFLQISLEKLRAVLVDVQSAETKGGLFSDPCGVILKKQSGDYVKRGDAITSVRAESSLFIQIEDRLKAVFSTLSEPKTSRTLEVIHDV